MMNDICDIRRVEIDAYHTVDIGIDQRLFKQLGFVEDAVLSLYVRNLFDEKYYDASGFPATDRFVGASLRFCL